MDDTGAVHRWKSKTEQPPQLDPAKHQPIDPGTVAGLRLWLDSSDKKSLQIEKAASRDGSTKATTTGTRSSRVFSRDPTCSSHLAIRR